MREVLILSGKGGAGKTSITACFAKLSENAIFVDCDVDASNLPMLLDPHDTVQQDFRCGHFPVLDPELCTFCGKCAASCPFQEIYSDDGRIVFADSCESCGVCADNCPQQAITLQEKVVGKLMNSVTGYGRLFHAELLPGAENSGKLIAELRRQARDFAERSACQLIISDGPPGIGCPVISASSGVDHALVVTEPTLSGIHDMERLAALLRQFEIPFAVIINKADLDIENREKLRNWCRSNRVELLGEISFDRIFTRALSEGKTVLDLPHNQAAADIIDIWEKTKKFIYGDKK